jgi:hypothetical protein
MHFPETSIENLRGFGYTEDEARFLYLVATHSGYFSTRQYLAFTGAKSGDKSVAFTQKVLGKGHATARLLLRNGRVYHLFSRLVYRAIGRENLRNRREHSVEHMRAKLAILDFVLGHLDYRYLETETEKVDYFCRKLSIGRALLPSKRYKGAIREKTTDRYFVDKFPLFFTSESPSSPPVVTFSFVDPGLLSLASFETHLFAYSGLFSAMAPLTTNPDPGVEGLRYFHYRHMWETKQYGRLNVEQIEFLNEAKKRFNDALTDIRYEQWLKGQITAGDVSEEFRRLAPRREVSFRTELVDGQTALFEARVSSKNRELGDHEVTDSSQPTFGSAFGPTFEGNSRQAEQK